jgi:kynurenine formamidase
VPACPASLPGLTFSTHDEVRDADGYKFSLATMALMLGDHSGTHVDAPRHFNTDPKAIGIDQVPLENFFTEAGIGEHRPQ